MKLFLIALLAGACAAASFDRAHSMRDEKDDMKILSRYNPAAGPSAKQSARKEKRVQYVSPKFVENEYRPSQYLIETTAPIPQQRQYVAKKVAGTKSTPQSRRAAGFTGGVEKDRLPFDINNLEQIPDHSEHQQHIKSVINQYLPAQKPRQSQTPESQEGKVGQKFASASSVIPRYQQPIRFVSKYPETQEDDSVAPRIYIQEDSSAYTGNNVFRAGDDQSEVDFRQDFAGVTGRPIPIIKYVNNPNRGDGSYNFEYETANGIVQHEEGHLENVGNENEENVVTGAYSYTGPDGVVYSVQYIADANGFRAYGDHIPTPPSIPDAILESLEKNAAEDARQKAPAVKFG